MNRHPLVGWLLLAPSLLLLGGLVVFPIVYNVSLSLHDKHAFMPVQSFVGLKHYVYFAYDEEFWSSVRYGLIYARARRSCCSCARHLRGTPAQRDLPRRATSCAGRAASRT